MISAKELQIKHDSIHNNSIRLSVFFFVKKVSLNDFHMFHFNNFLICESAFVNGRQIWLNVRWNRQKKMIGSKQKPDHTFSICVIHWHNLGHLNRLFSTQKAVLPISKWNASQKRNVPKHIAHTLVHGEQIVFYTDQILWFMNYSLADMRLLLENRKHFWYLECLTAIWVEHQVLIWKIRNAFIPTAK